MIKDPEEPRDDLRSEESSDTVDRQTFHSCHGFLKLQNRAISNGVAWGTSSRQNLLHAEQNANWLWYLRGRCANDSNHRVHQTDHQAKQGRILWAICDSLVDVLVVLSK